MNYYAQMRKKMRKKKRLPPAVLLIPLCAAVAVCVALAMYARGGRNSGSEEAEEYYGNNSVIIDMIDLENSEDMLTETQVISALADRGFGRRIDADGNLTGYPVTYGYSPGGDYVDETEVSAGSADRHPMYQTFYVSGDKEGNQIGWVIDVINGEVFARPVSFLLETTCDREILLTEDREGKFTGYYDGKFYITIPYETAVTAVTVDKIDAETLDGITFDTLSALTGAARLATAGVGGGEGEPAGALKASAPLASAARAAGDDTAIIVSLGDSFSSGEGIEPFIDQELSWYKKVQSQDFLAHRSLKSWPKQLKVAGKNVELYFVAVSGAETKHIDTEEQPKTYRKDIESVSVSDYIVGAELLPVQLDIFNKINGKEVDFVTLTIGGNDVDFAEVIKTCAMESSYLKACQGKITKLETMINERLDNIYAYMTKILRVYEAIEARVPYAAILVAGYPELLDAKGAVISMQEAALVNNAVTIFNMEIESLVTACWESGMNIYFVDVESEFNGHEAYTKEAWLNPIMVAYQPQDLTDSPPSAYSIHPNARGAKAYADCVNAEIAAYALSGEFGGNLYWEFDIKTDTLTISGTGKMPDYSIGLEDLPWYRFKHQVKKVVIEDGVTSIGKLSFCGFDKLQSVELGGAVTGIGESAFLFCEWLSEVSALPERLSYIGPGAFYGTALTKLNFSGTAPEAWAATAGEDASFTYGTENDTGRITLYYPAGRQDSWDPDGDGKWKGYHVEPYDIAVSGTVIDFDTYKPVKNALIQITKQGDEKVYEAKTDENGQFTVRIPGLVPVTLTIKISAEGYESQTLHQTSGIMAIQLMIPLRPSNSVTVTVVDGNGKGLSGVAINGTGLPSAPVTGADGSAKFRLSAGTYSLTVSDGKNTAEKTLTVADGPVELEITLGQDDILEKLRNAKAGDVIKLTGDVEAKATENVRISGGAENNPVVLDLNGHTLTVTGEYDYLEVYRGALKIRDSSAAGTGTLNMSGYLKVYGSELFLESGTLDVRGSAGGAPYAYYGYAIVIDRNAAFTMTGGTIKKDTDSTGGVVCAYSGSFTMAGGTINSGNHMAVYAVDGSFTMEGGTINSGEVLAVGVGGTRFTMNGGEIISSSSVVVYGNDKKATIILHGGRITNTSTGYCVQTPYKNSLFISDTIIRTRGSYFFKYGYGLYDFIIYCPSGYTSTDKPDEDGYYYLIKE